MPDRLVRPAAARGRATAASTPTAASPDQPRCGNEAGDEIRAQRIAAVAGEYQAQHRTPLAAASSRIALAALEA
jgi:hypothetical protein